MYIDLFLRFEPKTISVRNTRVLESTKDASPGLVSSREHQWFSSCLLLSRPTQCSPDARRCAFAEYGTGDLQHLEPSTAESIAMYVHKWSTYSHDALRPSAAITHPKHQTIILNMRFFPIGISEEGSHTGFVFRFVLEKWQDRWFHRAEQWLPWGRCLMMSLVRGVFPHRA